MSINLDLDDAQAGIASVLSQFCEERCDAAVVKAAAGEFPAALWRELAEIGVLAAGAPEGEGGPREIIAAMETLGFAAFPGPLPATFLAMQLLDEKERVPIAAGRVVASVACPPLLPLASFATVFLEIEGEKVYRLTPRVEPDRIDTLGGEVWGRGECERIEVFEDATRAIAVYHVALASYLVGLSDALLRAAADHAATRRQFGQAIGQFQAVAHPLADCHIRIEAARLVARSAADLSARGVASAAFEARIAIFSARRAAVNAAHSCHQVFGAMGIALEGPAFHLSRRIMQLAAQTPTTHLSGEALYLNQRVDGETKGATT